MLPIIVSGLSVRVIGDMRTQKKFMEMVILILLVCKQYERNIENKKYPKPKSVEGLMKIQVCEVGIKIK